MKLNATKNHTKCNAVKIENKIIVCVKCNKKLTTDKYYPESIVNGHNICMSCYDKIAVRFK